MSTLCRAKWQLRNVRGARPSRSLGGASRPALPVKDVFGGTPNTARETHALPINLSAIHLPVSSLSIQLIGQTVLNLVKSSQTDAASQIVGNYDANAFQ
jgi:hypothetical protein